MPGRSKTRVDGGKAGRATAGGILSRSVHAPRATLCFSSSEQAVDLQPPVQGRFPDSVGDCRRSKAPRSGDRFSGGAAYMGTSSSTPSASALRNTWWWHITRQVTVDQLPERI